MRNLAIIPARSGSKGLPDKNIRLLDGKPLLAYSILSAAESGVFDEIMVSTDSKKYAEIARNYGAEVPFLRSEELSTDTASIWDNVSDILEKYTEEDEYFDIVTLLQPTSPLRTGGDILCAYNMMLNKSADSIISICETEHSPLWCNVLPDDFCLDGFLDNGLIGKARQKLSTYYRINGAIYMIKTNCLEDISNIYSEKSYAYIMPTERSVDIDSVLDFKIAQIILKDLK